MRTSYSYDPMFTFTRNILENIDVFYADCSVVSIFKGKEVRLLTNNDMVYMLQCFQPKNVFESAIFALCNTSPSEIAYDRAKASGSKNMDDWKEVGYINVFHWKGLLVSYLISISSTSY